MTNPNVQEETQKFVQGLVRRNPGEPEFHQAVEEVAGSLMPFVLENPKYKEAAILERMTEPDRVIIFRVCWEDDNGHIRVQRGYRVQNNNAIGPYKGGLRFHPSVNQSILKFLAFEQTFNVWLRFMYPRFMKSIKRFSFDRCERSIGHIGGGCFSISNRFDC